MIHYARERFLVFGQQLVAVNENGSTTYAGLVKKIDYWLVVLRQWDIKSGDRVGLVTDYHVEVVALIVALMESGCIVIPLSIDDVSLFQERLDIARASKIITVNDNESVTETTVICKNHVPGHNNMKIHPLMQSMLANGDSGFVIFTSGSTGKSKAVLLKYELMIDKYSDRRGKAFRTLLFLKLDHIGGLNTLFSVVFNGGTIITPASRQAKDICKCIEEYSVELLPTTPSFLNMLLMSNLHRNHNLNSLNTITYGTEVMPSSTLTGMHEILPEVKFKQTYGLSELGILSTKSKSSNSKWMKIGGDDFEVKVNDGVLWIRSKQAMLGYLNAESPFDEDGWYNTNDKVEVDGDYYRILGRESEIINVAGEKVYPIEIESYLLTLSNVKDVVVKSKPSPVVGQIIWADFILEQPEELVGLRKRVVENCRNYFPEFKVPGFITVSNRGFVGNRFKKIRRDRVDNQVELEN